ncbi:alpha/beta hydrolase [Nodosilinea sp. LEGE 07088]|uniref:alpha/beta hydrolase n=1 Tax=Nodosilinea sp. LEGE 07088 TaxID=2777968 RepID=UPI00187F0413|nr:alpha/beta hydrolase [Nodosilinea sp. LEGE 07088]MBE9137306.1 alpha/beta hydrolase [Nodosilinea sp. LEGE 07088]
MTIKSWTSRRLQYLAILVGTALLPSLWLGLPGLATERILINFGPLGRSIAVEDLETYARTGKLNNELKDLGRYLSPQQLQQFRDGLTLSADVDVVTVSQFLYTPQGEAILESLGEVVQTAGRINGDRAIRAALILAAADSDGGFNLLNILQHFPTEGAQVDVQRLSVVARAVLGEINQTQQAVAQVRQQAIAGAEPDSGAVSIVDDPAELGSFRWQKQVLNQLTLPTDLYLPAGQNAPLVVISHGLGGDRTTFAYLAEHLASHGLAVAVVEHPGSSSAQIEALLTDQTDEAIEPDEMIRRATSIQTLLDQLETVAQDPALGSRINLDRVGVLGQSLGGYTTLALAGATVDPASLEQNCPPQISSQLNLSMLLQCSVLTLPQPLPTLQDSRVKAAIAINPLDSAVFGPAGMANITVPTMVVSGSADSVTPALAEQIRPVTWLEAPERYLMLMENGTHFSTIFDPQADTEALPVPPQAIGPDPAAAQQYVKATGVAFFKTYLAEVEGYRPYLNQTYIDILSQPDLPLYLVRDFTLEE